MKYTKVISNKQHALSFVNETDESNEPLKLKDHQSPKNKIPLLIKDKKMSLTLFSR